MTEIAISNILPAAAPTVQANSDNQLIEIWLHGRSSHTQRAYGADLCRFRNAIRKPLPAVTLADLQNFADSLGDLAPTTAPSPP